MENLKGFLAHRNLTEFPEDVTGEEQLEYVLEIVNEMAEDVKTECSGDNAFQGFLILSKYFDYKSTDLIAGADHDIVYSVDISEALTNGLTYEDTIELFKLNWMIEDGSYFAVFV